MATIADAPRRVKPLGPDGYEMFLSIGAILLLCAVITALVRGHGHWREVPWTVWAHLATILTALVLTPVQLLRPRGDRPHRLLGTIWVLAMLGTALLSFLITDIRPGHWSLIHLLSAFTLVQAPRIWWSARAHKVAVHRHSVRLMVTGALLVAGFFTFPFNRMLGRWLFGA